MLGQLGQHLVDIQTQLREAALRHLDVQLLILRAKQLHLVHIRNAQQFLAHVVGHFLDLGGRKALGLQGVNHAVYIAKFVVKKRPHHALG